ncbi:epimerase [Naasia sp. SYSU D00057]|uniref:epimerase n=1 Tax=Naasia sp. SYSU D00057 TaxID=2817380 RepID=UPI001B301F1C|nr:DUF1731 domain-containing protein [Naasia sp. SYSU D00057]
MPDRIVLAGASGFLGRYLTDAFRAEGASVATIGRRGADATWGDPDAIRRVLDGADLLVNLAGKSVDCRYSARNRAEILRSRVETTRALAAAVAACTAPPPLWINSSTATVYRHAEDRPMTESAGEIGDGFSVSVATAWEEAFFAGDLPATRRVALRLAIVLGDGSSMIPLLGLTRLGLGGSQLDGRWPATRARLAAGTYHRFRSRGGRQRFSWVALEDVLGIIRFVRDHPELEGPLNVASPNPSDNRTLMRILRRAVGMPVGIPLFRWMLELGAIGIRTESELILKSRWVVPKRLLAAGYRFRRPDLEPTVRAIVAERRRR